jgi:hypothetical protein
VRFVLSYSTVLFLSNKRKIIILKEIDYIMNNECDVEWLLRFSAHSVLLTPATLADASHNTTQRFYFENSVSMKTKLLQKARVIEQSQSLLL